MLVHDASLGDEALQRGCVDLVLGGHLHSQVGPEPVSGLDGQVGYRYVNGTTGGAAKKKSRRDAKDLRDFLRPEGLRVRRGNRHSESLTLEIL